MSGKGDPKAYWRASIKVVVSLLVVWFTVSFGCGILFKESLDKFSVGGAPLGFWMAQQGAIIFFVGLLVLYSFLMNRLDTKYGYGEEED